jgi:peptidoglycan/LPS O-acetylase OafA/YrhL
METTPQPAAVETKAQAAAITSNSTTLDQWRGLALVLVLISHGFFFTGRVNGLGRVGVNLFFFISGVLVFKSLTSHRDATDWERTRHFWKRRLRRLFPALAAYVLVMIPIVYALRNVPGAVTPSMHDYFSSTPSALAFAINYWPQGAAWSLGHLWSVSCEMQFYLLAPIILVLGGSTSGQRNLVWGALLLALAAWGFVGGERFEHSKYHFEIAVWPMMLGFFCEYRKDLFQRVPSTWFRGIILASVAIFVVMTCLMLCGFEMKYLVIASGSLSFIPCFLAYLGRRTLGGPIGRMMTWLGERTYSIYIWQQPLTICHYLPTVLHPVGAVASTIVGGVWFRFFEYPFLSAKRQTVADTAKISSGPA